MAAPVEKESGDKSPHSKEGKPAGIRIKLADLHAPLSSLSTLHTHADPQEERDGVRRKANTSFQFPDKEDRGKGITLKAHLPAKTNAVTESIYVIATKQPILINPGVQEGIFGIYDGKTAFMGDLIRDIVTIPLSERTEKLMQYQVIQKKGGSQ